MKNIKEFFPESFSKDSISLLSFDHKNWVDLDILLLDKDNKKIRFIFEWIRSVCIVNNEEILEEYRNIATGFYQ